MKIENAVITEADVVVEDHGITTLKITFRLQGGTQGLPCYGCGSAETPNDSLSFLCRRLMDTLGVSSLSALVGKNCRVKSHGLIRSVGHFMEDRWFEVAEEMEARDQT